MIICIPVIEDQGLNSLPYNHFGSAPAFVLHNLASAETKVIANRNEHHEHGRCQPLQALAGEAVDVILVGGIGARALTRLQASGVQVFQAQNRTVRENIDAFRQGRLPEFTVEAACRGHGHGRGRRSGSDH
jgi:predicted Fe-Mo cluster-binding NifX family protein